MPYQFSSLLDLYHMAAIGSPDEFSQKLWGDIPTSFGMMKKLINQKKQIIDFKSYNENTEIFRKIVSERHRKLGTLTFQVKYHQPLLFGGPLFLINKVSFAEWLGNYLDMSTFFFIGDHDSIQNELTISRFPQANSYSGLELTPTSWGVPEGTPIYRVPLPDQEWFRSIKQKILDNLRLLMKYAKIKTDYRQLFIERFYSWFDLIYDSAITAKYFSYWIQKLWSQLFNVRNNLSLFLTPESDDKYRQLISPGFEFLLTEKNRLNYIKTLNNIRDEILSKNLEPGLPYRKDGYVPFFLECMNCENNTRVELRISDPGTLEGKCPICQEDYSFSYNMNNPDLSEIEKKISPRSDSRAVVNNFTFPLLAHVGGAGETQYYSAVIPAMKKLEINPPIVIRSNRVHYNTPWAEKSAQNRQNPILSREVYDIFDSYNKSTDTKIIQSSLERMREYLVAKYEYELDQLNEKQENLQTDPKNNKLRKTIRDIELMLSHNFGRYAPDKKASEVSWNWLDLAVLTGIHQISNIFQRQLKESAFLGYTWYITPGKFT
ncbi:MAG: hypothetical protein ACXACU_17270 [Candidatus Hodarchaeales archaeon]